MTNVITLTLEQNSFILFEMEKENLDSNYSINV